MLNPVFSLNLTKPDGIKKFDCNSLYFLFVESRKDEGKSVGMLICNTLYNVHIF